MPSNRSYEEIVCSNPACGTEFAPHDRRQIYCTTQCRINFYNDKKHFLDQDRYFSEKKLRECDQKLELLMKSNFYNNEKIEQVLLAKFDIDQSIGSLVLHLDTGRPIRWYHSFGIELVNERLKLYTIHQRTNISMKNQKQ